MCSFALGLFHVEIDGVDLFCAEERALLACSSSTWPRGRRRRLVSLPKLDADGARSSGPGGEHPQLEGRPRSGCHRFVNELYRFDRASGS